MDFVLTHYTKAIQDYVFTLSINRSSVNGALAGVLKLLPNLTKLELKKDVIWTQNTNKEKRLWSQVNEFGKALQATTCLCSLSFSNCEFNDDLIRLLLLALDESSAGGDIRDTLVHLDVVSEGRF